MSLKFVIGRAGSGKSRYCLDEVRQRLQEDPAGPPLILLVPEQATFQAEYDLVTTPGLNGTMRAQAISFRRLAYRVMQECGGTARIHIDETGKQMLLYKILQTHKEELAIFGRSADQQGFVAELNELFTEFRRYNQSARDLDDIYARAVRRKEAIADEPGVRNTTRSKMRNRALRRRIHLYINYMTSSSSIESSKNTWPVITSIRKTTCRRWLIKR